MDFTIYEKSGYVLKGKETADDTGILENPELFESEYTQMYAETEPLQMEM